MEPRFLLDGSLKRLAKYLRCAGFDAECDETPVRMLARRADAERRTLVTRSTRAGSEFERPIACVELRSTRALEQFHELSRALALSPAKPFSRCLACNVVLEPVEDRERFAACVPPRVLGSPLVLYACPRCAAVFWRGTHVANTCRALGIDAPES